MAALALHGLALLVHGRQGSGHEQSSRQPTVEQLIELDESPLPPAEDTPVAPVAGEQRPSGPARSPVMVPTRGAAAVRTVGASDTEANAAGVTATDAPGTEGAQASAEAPRPPINLGLDGRFFLGPPRGDGPRVRKSAIQRELEASMAASDVQRGLARGNVLLGSLHSAVREAGPVRGQALLSVTVGPDGSLKDVQFLQGLAADWASALSAFRELASRKRLRVPAGARGLRVTFSVQTKVQLPSGKETPVEVASPSLAPNGLTLHGTFDVADLAGGAQRMVYARVVSEEVL